MEIYRSLKDLPKIERGAVSIGKFDSIHLAHRKVLSKAHKISENEDRKFIVITFNNHPYDVIDPKKSPSHLSNEKFKISYFEEIGCDFLVLLNFSQELIDTSHVDFIKILTDRIMNIHFILGYNFRFGSHNKGNVDYIRRLMGYDEKNSIKLTVIDKIMIDDGVKLSSTLIRDLLKKGKIKKVNDFLNREYYIESNIIKGDKIGRTIGFPTINMYIDDMEYPEDGVYLTKIEIEDIEPGRIFRGYGMTYVGRRLVSGYKKSITLIETYIFDFDKIVYGKTARVFFLERIRDVIEFDSLESLKIQLEKDYNECMKKMEEKCL